MKILIALAAMIFTACSSTGGANLAEKNKAFRDYITANNIESVDKVNSFRFHGWSSLTNDFLIISSSPKRKYLVELEGYCSDIRWEHSIMINRSTSSTLHAKFDSISAVKSPKMKCRITSIYPLNKEQVEEIKAINKPQKEAS